MTRLTTTKCLLNLHARPSPAVPASPALPRRIKLPPTSESYIIDIRPDSINKNLDSFHQMHPLYACFDICTARDEKTNGHVPSISH